MIINNYRDALDLAHFQLQFFKLAAVVNFSLRCPIQIVRIFFRLVGDGGNASNPFSGKLLGDYSGIKLAIHRLATGQRHGIVE